MKTFLNAENGDRITVQLDEDTSVTFEADDSLGFRRFVEVA